MIDYLDYIGSDMENAKYYLSEAQKEYNSSLKTYNNSLKDYNYAVKNLKTDIPHIRANLYGAIKRNIDDWKKEA